MAQLKPTFTVDGKDYELKKTRALCVEFQRICIANSLSEEESNKYMAIKERIDELQEELSLLTERFKKAQVEYFDDPVNAEKKAKYKELKALMNEAKSPILDGRSEEMQYTNKLTKIMLDNYEKAIIFAISEQYNMSKSNAEDLWKRFVETMGVAKASEWVYAIGDTLFSEEEDSNDFLAKKRIQLQDRMKPRKK